MIASRFCGRNLASCGRFGCMRRRRTPSTAGHARRPAPAARRTPASAASASRGERRGAQAPRRPCPVGQGGGRGADQDGERRSGRRGRRPRRPASARGAAPSAMPSVFQGKPGEHVAAQPFGWRSARPRAPGCGPGRGAQRSAREGEAEGREKAEQRRQAEHAERQRPGELVGLDQEGRAEPPQPGDEDSRSPSTSRRRPPPGGRARRAEPLPGRAVEQPDGRRRATATRAGRNPKGGMASAPTAPAPAAISQRRQPRGEDDPVRQAGSFGSGALRAAAGGGGGPGGPRRSAAASAAGRRRPRAGGCAGA